MLNSLRPNSLNTYSLTAFFLFLLPLSVCFAEDADPQALFDEAKSVGTRGDLVVFGKTNLVIRGTNMEGDGVKRPSSLLSRAAEIWNS